MTEEFLKTFMEPIVTREDLEGLEEGDWVWDSNFTERRAHGRTLNPGTITENVGFRLIHVLDNDLTVIKPFMLSTFDSYSTTAVWEYFTPNRFWKFKKGKEEKKVTTKTESEVNNNIVTEIRYDRAHLCFIMSDNKTQVVGYGFTRESAVRDYILGRVFENLKGGKSYIPTHDLIRILTEVIINGSD